MTDRTAYHLLTATAGVLAALIAPAAVLFLRLVVFVLTVAAALAGLTFTGAAS